MDEVDWRMIYNEACKSAEKVTAPETKQCLLYVLQLLDGIQEQITEMKIEEDC